MKNFSLSLLSLVFATAMASPAIAQNIELEDVTSLICRGEGRIFYLQGLSPIQQDEQEDRFSGEFRTASFVVAGTGPESVFTQSLQGIGIGQLRRGMTKAYTLQFIGAGRTENVASVNLQVYATDTENSRAFLKIGNTPRLQLSCRITTN